jgi:ribosomal protein S19E (S16A)
MSALLDQLSREVADRALMDQVAAQMNHMRESDPGAWADYVHEGMTWEEATIEHLDA